MDIGKTPEQIAATEEWRKSRATKKEKQAKDYVQLPNRWSAFQIIVVILLAWIAINIELVVGGIVDAGVRVGT